MLACVALGGPCPGRKLVVDKPVELVLLAAHGFLESGHRLDGALCGSSQLEGGLLPDCVAKAAARASRRVSMVWVRCAGLPDAVVLRMRQADRPAEREGCLRERVTTRFVFAAPWRRS